MVVQGTGGCAGGDWSFQGTTIIGTIMSSGSTSKTGPSVQSSSQDLSSQVKALSDQVAGKVGPLVSEYSGDTSARMVSEF